MKTKLRLLVLALLLSVSLVNAQKTDVWDFGGVALDANLYNNMLTSTVINSNFYAFTTPAASGAANTSNVLTHGGTAGNTNAFDLTGGLTFRPNTNDRLYVNTPTTITRYGDNNLGVSGTTYISRIYCNGNSNVTLAGGYIATSTRVFAITLNEDDEVTVVTRLDNAAANLNVVNTTTNGQTENIPIANSTTAVTEAKFMAKQAGIFKFAVYDNSTARASYYRILRKPATYTTINGSVDETQAPGISGYSVVFTNPAGKTWTAPVTAGAYSVTLPAGYTYQMSFLNANGYVINNGSSLAVTTTTTSYAIVAYKVPTFTVSGSITGLGTDISKLAALTYTPDASANKIYIPMPVLNTAAGTYTVELEPSTQYTVSGTGVNDYEILSNTITITGATTANVGFTAKTTYPITINTTGLDATQISNLKLTFTNLNESGYVYNFNSISGIALRNGTYSISYSGLDSSVVVMTLTSNLKVNNATVTKTLDFVAPAPTSSIAYASVLAVGTDKPYKTINAALADVTRMTARTATERVTIMIDPGNYEEMIDVTQANVTLKNAATTPSIALQNKGVDIDPAAVRITSYYGLGYNYYSMKSNQKWDADVLRVNKENGSQPYTNASGTTNNSYWNATLIISANGFVAEDIIIENSYNQYISLKESQDVIELASGNKGVRSTVYKSTAVQDKSFVERAAAFAVKNGIDKVILNKCRVIGRQDSFYGGTNARVVVYKGVMMGATDYIFGAMNAVFYKTDLAMNTSDVSSDICFITAAQQSAGRGYLMYECKVTTAVPGTETASVYRSKPGYFGRPWLASTSEVVFYNTTIETSDYPGNIGKSLITPIAWDSSLSGTSPKMYEYGTIENSGVNNQASRAGWATKLSSPTLSDNTAITTLNFTKGSDGWDPLPQLISNESLGVKKNMPTSSVNVVGYKNRIAISNVKSETAVTVYSITGAKVKAFKTTQDVDFEFQNGVWIVTIKAADGQKSVKVITN